MTFPDLPINQVLPDLRKALATGSAVLASAPGSGKTTIVPLALLSEPWMRGKKILMLEPRRLATRAAAFRMAFLLGERVGMTVGYQVRFDRKISRSTRIEVLTEGILTRRIQNDAELDDVGLVIFDEFHERSIHADLALALCLDLCQLKEDLRLLVMSATLETSSIARLLGDVPVIIGKGQSHEVEIEYCQHEPGGRISEVAVSGLRRVISDHLGDVLVFLPGTGEIRDVSRRLSHDKAFEGVLVLPLYGDLSQENQDRAILPDPDGRRRVILATSIAETSLTIEGISCVVDSGWSRRPQFDPGNGLSRLKTVRVSKAAAKQRAGRAGRLGPGYCLRLWTKGQHYSMPSFLPPEITTIDLAPLALELALWGINNPDELHWLDPPRSTPYQQAKELLFALQAINTSGRITDTGRQMAALPIHPRLGHMLVMAKRKGQAQLACDVAAILSERDILRRDGGPLSVDIHLRLELLATWRKKGGEVVRRQGGSPSLCRRIDTSARQWHTLIGQGDRSYDRDTLGSLLVYAYPDRIGRRRHNQGETYLLATGRAAVLPPADPMACYEYLVAPQMDAGFKEGRIFLAESLDLAELKVQHAGLFTESEHIYWDDSLGKVLAVKRIRLGAITIEEHKLTAADPESINRAMQAGIRKMGIDSLPWCRDSRQLQARVHCLRSQQGEAEWPDLSDEHLLHDLGWLEPYLQGLSRAEHLKQLDLCQVFNGVLGWEKQKALDRDAPVSMTVPSGSKIRIQYRIGEAPVLAVRIQEMFGLDKSPAICNGKVLLLLHLLSPAQRPIQVTSDLAGFWRRSYAEVKKELKGRYPKHFWPDDPLMAKATRGVKRIYS